MGNDGKKVVTTRLVVECRAGEAFADAYERTFQTLGRIAVYRGNGISSFPDPLPVHFKTSLCIHATADILIRHIKIVQVGDEDHVSDCTCGADHGAVVTYEADVCDCLDPDRSNPVYRNGGCVVC